MPAFLSPLFLVGVAAAAIPIAIHLFYRRTEPVIDFAAMRYLRRAPVEHSRRRRLRELVLLALRVAALVLLALAFARPYFSDSVAAQGGDATLVMIDTSASLSAPGRFDQAVARARQALQEAPATHAVGLATFAQAADVVAPVSQDRAGALAALAQVRPGAGATRYRAALQGAADALEGRSGRIVVVTDLQQSGWDTASDAGIPESIGVELADIGAPETNLGVTSLRVDGADAVAVVQNFSTRPATDQVVFAVDARRIGAVPLTLAAGATVEARVPLEGVASGGLSASITDRDGYTADNVRYAVLDAADAVSVLAVTPTGHPSEALTFAPDDSRHPVFRVFGGAGTLANVGFSRAVRISAPSSASVIARYSDGSPALVEEGTAGGRVLVFGSDLNYRWNDFPLQPGFVPFVHEMVRYLASPRTSRTEFLVGDFQAATTPGIADLQGRRVAVNPDPRESDPARMAPETFQAGISRLNAAAARTEQATAQQREDGQVLWWYGLLVMVVSLAAEGIIGRRLG